MFLNTPKVERQSGFEALPKGWYRAMITKAEGKDTQAGTGRYLSLTYDVISGDYKGRKIFSIYNIKNPNELAVKIGQSDMKALAEALGHPAPFNYESDYLKFVKDKVCLIRVGQRKDKQSGEMRNNITDYKSDSDDEISTPEDDASSSLDEIPF